MRAHLGDTGVVVTLDPTQVMLDPTQVTLDPTQVTLDPIRVVGYRRADSSGRRIPRRINDGNPWDRR